MRALPLILSLCVCLGCQRLGAIGADAVHPEHEGAGAAQGSSEGHEGHGHEGHGHEEHGHEEHGHEQPSRSPGHEDERHGEHLVKLSKIAIEDSGIRLGKASAELARAELRVLAEIQLDPDRVAHVSPLVSGQLLDVGPRVGEQVVEGQRLAGLRSVELGQARAELSRSAALLELAEQDRDRQRRLRAEGINAERSLIEAELAYEQAVAERDAARSRLRVYGAGSGSGPDASLESPMAGVILERHASRGESVSAEDTLFVVADLSRVWVIGKVYEQDLAKLSLNLPARLSLSAYPGRTWQGKVDWIADVLDVGSRSLAIRVELDNPEGLLRPGLLGSLHLSIAESGASSLWLPQAAVQAFEGSAVIFVAGHEEGTFEAREVELGRRDEARVEILGGLDAEDAVVLENAFILRSELMRSSLGHGHAH